MRTRREINKAIRDSKKYFKKNFPNMDFNKPLINITELVKGLKALAVAHEICTLKWMIGKGKLNCYSEKKEVLKS